MLHTFRVWAFKTTKTIFSARILPIFLFIPFFIIVKHNLSQDSLLTMSVVLLFFFFLLKARLITWVSVRSCVCGRIATLELSLQTAGCDLVSWMNPVVFAFRGLYCYICWNCLRPPRFKSQLRLDDGLMCPDQLSTERVHYDSCHEDSFWLFRCCSEFL